jgi:hypothetical protein
LALYPGSLVCVLFTLLSLTIWQCQRVSSFPSGTPVATETTRLVIRLPMSLFDSATKDANSGGIRVCDPQAAIQGCQIFLGPNIPRRVKYTK